MNIKIILTFLLNNSLYVIFSILNMVVLSFISSSHLIFTPQTHTHTLVSIQQLSNFVGQYKSIRSTTGTSFLVITYTLFIYRFLVSYRDIFWWMCPSVVLFYFFLNSFLPFVNRFPVIIQERIDINRIYIYLRSLFPVSHRITYILCFVLVNDGFSLSKVNIPVFIRLSLLYLFL